MIDLDPEDTRLLVGALRDVHRWNQEEFAAQAGVDPSSISRWENGWPLTLRFLERLAAAARVPMAHIEQTLLPALRATRLAALTGLSPLEAAEELPVVEDLASAFAVRLAAPFAALETTVDALDLPPGEGRVPSAADRAAVPALAERYLAADAAKRAFFVERGPEFQTWHFAEWLAEESARAATGKPQEALGLARHAVRAAELATAEEKGPWTPRLLGWVWPFLANAHRASQELKAAEAASRKGCGFWKRGAGGDPAGLLPEWRLLDLEASLRRDQRRFPEALELHRRALTLAPQVERGRLLLTMAATFEQKGNYEEALATLHQAAPRIDPHREPGHRWGLCLMQATSLCHLGRAGEAAARLPELRSLTVKLDNALHRIRVRWLEGRVAAGLGRAEEARAAFEQARLDFELRDLPFDSALVSLDLAVLLREQQRWPEIRTLAAAVVRVFGKGKIHREARAAMLLLQEAATKEAVTVELLRRLQEYLQQAQRRPGLRFVAGAGKHRGGRG